MRESGWPPWAHPSPDYMLGMIMQRTDILCQGQEDSRLILRSVEQRLIQGDAKFERLEELHETVAELHQTVEELKTSASKKDAVTVWERVSKDLLRYALFGLAAWLTGSIDAAVKVVSAVKL